MMICLAIVGLGSFILNAMDLDNFFHLAFPSCGVDLKAKNSWNEQMPIEDRYLRHVRQIEFLNVRCDCHT